ncbi:hypothetical protein MLD52_12680 [Puniceicoccaceae bacterium K14]|nr:hypothetical protein [Puniceicoccaceae bacterium K14]
MSDTDTLHSYGVKDFDPANWYTSTGVRKKHREILKRGLPYIRGCLFFTLTIDPSLGTEKETYELGKDALRRFLEKLRKYWGKNEPNGRHKFGWAWKLEFQANGYAHWHLIVKTKKLVRRTDLHLINQYWGLGRTNLKKIKSEDFDYLFKYVSKCAAYSQGDPSGIALPTWVLDYTGKGADGKPFTRMRFWQTGSGFYDGPPKDPPKKKRKRIINGYPEGAHSLMRYTIREVEEIHDRTALLCIKIGDRIIRSSRITFTNPWNEVRQRIVNTLVKHRVEMSWGMYPPFKQIIQKELKSWQIKTKELLSRMESKLPMVSSVAA